MIFLHHQRSEKEQTTPPQRTEPWRNATATGLKPTAAHPSLPVQERRTRHLCSHAERHAVPKERWSVRPPESLGRAIAEKHLDAGYDPRLQRSRRRVRVSLLCFIGRWSEKL